MSTIYVMSNKNGVLGVFSTILIAQRYYNTINLSLKVKLEEYKLDYTIGKDVTNLLIHTPTTHYYEHDNYIEREIVECDFCGGEDCARDGECCNMDYD